MNRPLADSLIFVPAGGPADQALRRTTHLGIGAHHDDLEIMAIDGILRCYDCDDAWFTGVIVTDGAGAPRAGTYAEYTDAEMKRQRAEEQKEAATLGRYSAQIMLAHPSGDVKQSDGAVVSDLARIVEACGARVIYTHNLWDKHDTHVAVALRTIEAIRTLPREKRPQQFYGVEVWRDLDWVPDERKVVFDCSRHEQLQAALITEFESQIAGGKRYDLAIMGRRRAHATYLDPRRVDQMSAAAFGVDLTPLIEDKEVDVEAWAIEMVEAFKRDVQERLKRVT